ncbi:hypothetical protein BD410DRAFT_844719 [Rickenella mellea]|uniref:Fungal calcium binding protein domain-containing protein n=1 Tax=Rickenella mellea TaxID=50990 RepID=A0A4Y7PLX1_9AGAM|nr:hypothetical protein BD410DRAFT_844719 [Rickenella mellea]
MKLTIVAVLAAAACTVTANPAAVKRGCDILGCIEALAPAIVSCAAALAEEGENILEDIECFNDAADDISDPPSACSGCL